MSDYPWHTRDAINEAIRPLAKSYEVDALRSDVVRLEHSLREARSEVDGLRSQLQEVAQAVTDATQIISNLLDRVEKLEPKP